MSYELTTVNLMLSTVDGSNSEAVQGKGAAPEDHQALCGVLDPAQDLQHIRS